MLRAITLSLLALILAVTHAALDPSNGTCWLPQAAAGGAAPNAPAPTPGKEQRTDYYGDALPELASARLGTVRFRNGWLPVSRGLAYSPDGKVLAAVGGYGKSICLLDAATGSELRRVGPPMQFGLNSTLTFTPDGKVLLAARDGFAVLYDVASGRVIHQLQANQDYVSTVALSPDGKLVATAALKGTVSLWDMGSGKEVRRLQDTGKRSSSIGFSPDGKLLALASGEKRITLWELAAGKASRRLSPPVEAFLVAFSPDGKLLASTGKGGDVQLWDAASGIPVRTVPPRKERTAVLAIAFAPGGKVLAVGGYDGSLGLVDVETGIEGRQFHGQGLEVASLAFSPDGKNLAAASIWDAAPHIWDVAGGKEVPEFTAHYGSVIQMALAGDGRSLASFGLDGRATIWDLTTARPRKQFLMQLPPEITTMSTVAFDPRLHLLARPLSDDTVALRDLQQDKDVRELAVKKALGLAFSPDGTVLACGCEDTSIRFYDVTSGQERQRLNGAIMPTRRAPFPAQLAFTPDGKTLAAPAPDATMRLWEVRSGKELRRWDTGQTLCSALAFAPDGMTLASVESSGGVRGVRLRDVATGKLVRRLNEQEDCISIAFSPDGRFLCLGSTGPDSARGDASVRVCEMLTGQEVRRLRGHFGGVACLAFTADGRSLISGSDDTTLLVWDMTGQQALDQKPPRRLEAAEVEQLWFNLAGDAAQANAAMWRLVFAPSQALPLLEERLRPAQAPDPESVVRLVAELASDQFAVRDKARQTLEKLGDLAEPVLRKFQAGQPPLETWQRLEQLLVKCGPWSVPSPNQARLLRAIAVLEHLGTPSARKMLEALAGGAPAARSTREARAALGRLK